MLRFRFLKGKKMNVCGPKLSLEKRPIKNNNKLIQTDN